MRLIPGLRHLLLPAVRTRLLNGSVHGAGLRFAGSSERRVSWLLAAGARGSSSSSEEPALIYRRAPRLPVSNSLTAPPPPPSPPLLGSLYSVPPRVECVVHLLAVSGSVIRTLAAVASPLTPAAPVQTQPLLLCGCEVAVMAPLPPVPPPPQPRSKPLCVLPLAA